MKDRQFMVMLGLVVAAGLVMGLVAFRITGTPPATVTSNTAQSGTPKPPTPSGQQADEDWGSSTPDATADTGAPPTKDGESPTIATPEPAPPPPPEAPPATVYTDDSQ